MLPVFYPFAGKRILLSWTTYNDGQHVIIANTQKQAEQIFESVLKKHKDAIPTDFLEVELVGPTTSMLEVLEEERIKDKISYFTTVVVHAVEIYKEKYGELPQNITECTQYETRNFYHDNETTDPEHYHCDNCREKIKPLGKTWRELYFICKNKFEAQQDTQNNLFQKSKFKFIQPKETLALPAEENEVIWLTRADHGHHSSGNVFVEISCKEEFASHFRNTVLFLFRKLQSLDLSKLQDMEKQVKAILEQKEKQKIAYSESRFEKEQNRVIENLLELLKENT